MRKSEDNTQYLKKRKLRLAAKKAWVTIRNKKLEKATKNVKKIDKYVLSSEEKNTWVGNKIVTRFEKTPEDIACGGFWELRWAFGCPFNCSYCYLRGTLKGNMKPRYIKFEHIKIALEEAFQKITNPVIFNTGELSDSLMNPVLMEKIVDLFEEQKIHKVYLLSKCGPIATKFLTAKKRKQTICAWSINAPIVSSRWESMAAHPLERIEAAKGVWETGYDTRVRIDPIFPLLNWKEHYGNLIEKILANFTPNRIILGTPRGLWKTIKYAKLANMNMVWTQFFQEESGWGAKLSFEQRKEIYQFMIDTLTNNGYSKNKISICKDTTTMLDVLNIPLTSKICNCYGKG